MNHARWSIDFINRQRHRTNPGAAAGSKNKTLSKPKSIIDLVLEENESKKQQTSI